MTTLELFHAVVAKFRLAGIIAPEAEASWLLLSVLDCRRSDIFLHGTRQVPDAVLVAIHQAVDRRLTREPLAYILGEQEFYGRPFHVTPDVLIPRPETELLVERAVQSLRGMPHTRPPLVLDMGTGSGIIAVTLALEWPAAVVVGLDLSWPALQVARANAVRHGVAHRVHFLNSHWGGALRVGCAIDLLAANPPYVAKNIRHTLQPELAAEPEMALYSGEDGRADIDRIMAGAASLLRPGGTLLMEIGFDQGDHAVARLNSLEEFADIVVHNDYAGLPRILHASRRSESNAARPAATPLE